MPNPSQPTVRSDAYPFTAVVGAEGDPEPMPLALLLTTISPEIGGVLVRGEKGTAKSTVVRALAGVLPPIEVIEGDRFSSAPDAGHLSPDGPFADPVTTTRPVRLVELPVGATEDRVIGSLHLERALSHGRTEYEPGLLAAAHRGLLYVDEVNLLHDHLVDLLLDAAAMGRTIVERDGVSVTYPSRFVLVGTMNPEEGELRPQLLDRFGLTVEVAAPRDPATRAEVVRRRLAYDADPAGFVDRWAAAEDDLRRRIDSARELVGSVELSDAALATIAHVCAGFDVDGMRADIVTARTAVAHAAWEGRRSVTRADIRAAALLALPHRRRRNPFDAPGLDEELLDRLLDEADPPEPDPESDPEPDPEPEGGPEEDGSASHEGEADGGGEPESEVSTLRQAQDDASSTSSDSPTDSAESQTDAAGGTEDVVVAASGQAYRPRLFTVRGTGAGEAGRRSRAETGSGRRTGQAAGDQPGALDLVGTLRAAAPHQLARGREAGRVRLEAGDLRLSARQGRESNLVLFCVDASGSMAARRRMEQVKTAILSLLLDAYQRRDKVGLVTFRASADRLAERALPPTHSVDVAAARLAELPAGGRTPLAEGLLEAAEVLRLEKLRDPRRRPLLVVITDGRATHGPDPIDRSLRAARLLAETGVSAIVVDCEAGRMRLGLAHRLAEELHAEHVPLGEVSAEALTDVVREVA